MARPAPSAPRPSETTPTPVASLYVHAPFCARRCRYCDFAVSVRRGGGGLDDWCRALAAELDALAREGTFTLATELDTLYVGGGTPSLLGREAMHALAGVVGSSRLSGGGLEWTAEVNPESFGRELAVRWRGAGVNRVSVGVQTFDDGALRWMGRLHGPSGAAKAVAQAREVGFSSVSIDLIFGLPASLSRDWTADLGRALALEVEHVSLYGLTVEPETRLGRDVAEGLERVAGSERYREEYLQAAEALTDAGYLHYEVSNFARPGHEGRHNRSYWTGVPYLGLGNGAHSFAPPLRRWNERDWETYSTRLGQGELPEAGRETLTTDQDRLERIWLGLRVSEGISVRGLGQEGRAVVEEWVATGLAVCHGTRVRLTPGGWLLLDSLSVELADADRPRGPRTEAFPRAAAPINGPPILPTLD